MRRRHKRLGLFIYWWRGNDGGLEIDSARCEVEWCFKSAYRAVKAWLCRVLKPHAICDGAAGSCVAATCCCTPLVKRAEFMLLYLRAIQRKQRAPYE